MQWLLKSGNILCSYVKLSNVKHRGNAEFSNICDRIKTLNYKILSRKKEADFLKLANKLYLHKFYAFVWDQKEIASIKKQ